MRSEPEPVAPPVIPVKGQATLGRIGLAVSLIAPLTFLLMLLIKLIAPMSSLVMGLLGPGAGSEWPFDAIGLKVIFYGTPAGFILSLIGVIHDKRKWPSVVGLAVSGLVPTVFLIRFYKSGPWH
jgi:hypothetical protein